MLIKLQPFTSYISITKLNVLNFDKYECLIDVSPLKAFTSDIDPVATKLPLSDTARAERVNPDWLNSNNIIIVGENIICVPKIRNNYGAI